MSSCILRVTALAVVLSLAVALPALPTGFASDQASPPSVVSTLIVVFCLAEHTVNEGTFGDGPGGSMSLLAAASAPYLGVHPDDTKIINIEAPVRKASAAPVLKASAEELIAAKLRADANRLKNTPLCKGYDSVSIVGTAFQSQCKCPPKSCFTKCDFGACGLLPAYIERGGGNINCGGQPGKTCCTFCVPL